MVSRAAAAHTSSMDKPQPELLPLGTMAARARVTQRWLRTEAEAGRIPCLNADNRLLFHAETVERLLLDRARRQGQEEVAGG